MYQGGQRPGSGVMLTVYREPAIKDARIESRGAYRIKRVDVGRLLFRLPSGLLRRSGRALGEGGPAALT